jgi:hypothetical protein
MYYFICWPFFRFKKDNIPDSPDQFRNFKKCLFFLFDKWDLIEHLCSDGGKNIVFHLVEL